jgi:hypothetical protein
MDNSNNALVGCSIFQKSVLHTKSRPRHGVKNVHHAYDMTSENYVGFFLGDTKGFPIQLIELIIG